MNQLEEARQKINEIDKQIAALFEERMGCVGAVAEYKKERGLPIFDGSRENFVIQKNTELIKNDVFKPYYMDFLKDMMNVSKQYQHTLVEGVRVAYCGIEGAFANIAAKKIFPDGLMIPFDSFAKAYEAVENGDCNYAVLPTENSYAGEVGQTVDLLFEGNLFVNGMYSLKVEQNLVGVKGATVDKIKKVISHPQALSQCATFISQQGYEKEEAANTAMSAKRVAEMGDIGVAAIASAETAELYDLQVIQKNINESDTNTTKFAVVSRTYNENIVNKNSDVFLLMFTVKNTAGSLAKAISAIGQNGINLRVLKSRPTKTREWQYYFYAEADGVPSSEKEKKMLEALQACCETMKIVGHYSSDMSL